MSATVSAPSVRAIGRPLDADRDAYALSNADRPGTAVPVSGAVVRALLRSALHSHGSAVLEPGAAVTFTYGPTAAIVPAELAPVFRAVPCLRPPHTPECAHCGHWRGEHDHPAVPTACTRYRMRVGPARYKMPEHDDVAYAWVRRIGRARVVFEISKPSALFPGGTLAVHRYPALGDGPAEFCAHLLVIEPKLRSALLGRARSHVR